MITLKRLISINIVILLSYLIFWTVSSFLPNFVFDSYNSLLSALVSLLLSLSAMYSASIFNTFGKYFKVPALLISMGLLCNGLGDLFWYFLGMNGAVIVYPSIADIWYVLFYPITFLGIHILFAYINKAELSLPKLIHFITIGAFILFILGIFLSLKYTSVGFIPILNADIASFFDMVYLLADVFLLVHVLIILGFISNYPDVEHHLISPLYMITLSLIIVFIADVLFGYLTETGSYTSSGFTELLYLFFVFFMGTATSEIAYSTKPKFFKK
jgi:two-component system, sensor histidine kinase PdtaS